MKKMIAAFAIILGLSAFSQAQSIFPNGSGYNSYSGFLTNETALAYNKTFPLDLSPYVANDVSASVLYGSATISAVSFYDGSESSGSITIVSYVALSSANAYDNIQIGTVTNLSGAIVTLTGNGTYNFLYGQDWVGISTASAAQSLAIALRSVPWISSTSWTSNGIVLASTTYGSVYNTYGIGVNNSSVTAATTLFQGGRDNAVLTINGKTLTQGTNWQAGTSNTLAALSLGNAIAGAGLSLSTGPASGGGATIYTTSTFNGAQYNYSLVSSTPAAMSVSGPTLVNGVSPSFALNGLVITTTGTTNLTLGLPVLFSSSSVNNNTANTTGLVNQTTYYVFPISSYKFELVKYATSAVAGAPASDFVTFTSSQSQIVLNMDFFKLTPLAITGTPSFAWQVSNDNVNWINLGVSSVTVSAYSAGGAMAGWDFGALGLRYLRLNTVAPTAGGLVLQTVVNIKQQTTVR